MKKLIFTLFAAMLALSMNAQVVTIDKVVIDLANDYSSGCEIDINNDGIKEVIIGGSPNWNNIGSTIYDPEEDADVWVDSRAAWLLQWDGSDYKYSQFSENGIFGLRGSVIPCDFNGDGYVDIYIASGGDIYTLNGIYLNDGNGGFYKDESFVVVDENGDPIVYVDDETGEPRTFWDGSLVNWLPRNVDVADFNCDGLPDIVSCGWWLTASSEFAMAGVLLNNGDGTFTRTCQYIMGEEDNELAYAFALCSIKAYDLNNDGYPDILVQGNVDNGGEVSTSGRRFMTLVNMGEYNDPGLADFYDLGLSDGVSHNFGNGSIAVADYNNDGVPDIFITGEDPDQWSAGVVPEEWSYCCQLLKGAISRGDVSYSKDNTFVASDKDIRPLNANDTSVRAIDYNGDGYVDLFLPGWCTTQGMLDGGDATQAGWYLPGSASGLISYNRVPGASEHSVMFLDYGVEGDLNYSFTGYHSDENYFTGEYIGRSMVFTKNPWTVADRPDAPQNIDAVVDGNIVTLSWEPAASSMNNVTYEYYLKVNGKIYNGCTSFIGGDKDGVRKVLREGNAWQNTSLTLTLPDGAYEWGVQTINGALKGSTFASGNFTIGDVEPEPEPDPEPTPDPDPDTAVTNVLSDGVATGDAYNLAGQRVNDSYKGIVVKDGVKVLNK